jgi:hypothetical protein
LLGDFKVSKEAKALLIVWLDTADWILRGAKGSPGGKLVKTWSWFKVDWRAIKTSLNKSIVLFPNNIGSVASLPPK